LLSALDITATNLARKDLQNVVAGIPDLIGLHYVRRLLCLENDVNLCTSTSKFSYLLYQTDVQIKHVNDAIYTLSSHIDVFEDLVQAHWDSLQQFRDIVWASTLLQEQSQYRSEEIDILKQQRDVFKPTNSSGQHEYFPFFAYDVTDVINPEDNLQQQMSAVFAYIDLKYNMTQSVLVDPVIESFVVVLDTMHQLGQRTDVGVGTVAYLLTMSQGLENFLQSFLLYTVPDADSNAYQPWSYLNQAAALGFVIYGNIFSNDTMPESYQLEGILQLIFNENLAGDYSNAAHALADAYVDFIQSIRVTQDIILNSNVPLTDVLEEYKGFMSNLLSFTNEFNAEYELQYNQKIDFLNSIGSFANLGDGVSDVSLTVTYSYEMVVNAIGAYTSLMNLI